MKKIICSVLVATILLGITEAFANDLGFAALGAGIGALANGKRGAAVGALIGYGFSAAGRPQYDYGYGGYGYRPGWLNGPYCGEDSVLTPRGCARVYSQPVVQTVYVPAESRPAETTSTAQQPPSTYIVNSGNTVNNYYGDRASEAAIRANTPSASYAQKTTPKKIPKKIRHQKVVHPTGGY